MSQIHEAVTRVKHVWWSTWRRCVRGKVGMWRDSVKGKRKIVIVEGVVM